MGATPLLLPLDRDQRLDQYKGLLISLVVLGHVIETLRFPASTLALYLAIYVVHMPAFLLVAGALTKPRRFLDELVQTTRRLAPPYLFGVIGAALVALLVSGSLSLSFLPPPWTLWFLLTLATLRLLTALIGVSNRALVLVLLLAAGASLITLPAELSLGRSGALAIFFLIGARLGRERLLSLVERIGAWRGAFLTGTGLALAGATLLLADLPRSTLFWREAIERAPSRPLDALVVSLLLHLAALAVSLGLFALTIRLPHSRLFSYCGRESLTIYLGHALLLSGLRPTLRTLDLEGGAAILVVALLTVISTAIPLIVRRLIEGAEHPHRLLVRPPVTH